MHQRTTSPVRFPQHPSLVGLSRLPRFAGFHVGALSEGAVPPPLCCHAELVEASLSLPTTPRRSCAGTQTLRNMKPWARPSDRYKYAAKIEKLSKQQRKQSPRKGSRSSLSVRYLTAGLPFTQMAPAKMKPRQPPCPNS